MEVIMKALRRIAMILLLPAIMAMASLLFDQPRAEAVIECAYVCFWDGFTNTCGGYGNNCIGCRAPGGDYNC